MTDYWMWWIAGGGAGRRRAHDRHVLPARRRRRVRRRAASPRWLGAALPMQLARRRRRWRVAVTMVAHHWRAAPRRCRRRSRRSTSGSRCACWAGRTTARARVDYRGTQWDAELAAPGTRARRDDVHRRHARLDAADRGPPRVDRDAPIVPDALRRSTRHVASDPSIFTLALFVVALIVVIKAIRVVPQQHAWVVERLGRFYAVLEPGLNFVDPVRRPRRVPARPARDPARRAEPDLHHARQHAAAGRRHPVFPGDRPEARVVRVVELRARDHAARADDAAQRHRPHGARQDVRGARPDQRAGRVGARRRRRRAGASRCCATRSRT